MNGADEMPGNRRRASGRPFEGLGILAALVLALVATVVVLIAPGHHWGPEMWPFYVGTMGVVMWVAIDLWQKLRDQSADGDGTPADTHEDILARAAAEFPNPAGQGPEGFAEQREPSDRLRSASSPAP